MDSGDILGELRGATRSIEDRWYVWNQMAFLGIFDEKQATFV